MSPRLSGEYGRIPHVTIAAIAFYALVIFAGMSEYDGKWHRVHRLEAHKRNMTGGMNFEKDGINGTQIIYRCGTSETADPCYKGLHAEIKEIFFLSNILPFVPLFGWLLACNWSAPWWERLSWRRFRKPFLLLCAFYLYFYTKRFLMATSHWRIDMSDHVAIGCVGLSIAFREFQVARAWELQYPRISYFVPSLALIVLGLKAWQTYETTRLFHTPTESTLGLLVGLLFAFRLEPYLYNHPLTCVSKARVVSPETTGCHYAPLLA